jgi:serine protease Do
MQHSRLTHVALVFLLLAVGSRARGAPVEATPSSAAISTARALGDAFAEVVDRVMPTVVVIEVDHGEAVAPGLQELQRDFRLPGAEPSADIASISTGSGVILRQDGLVLTNHHVIDRATAVRVELHDGRRFTADVVASDPRTDIALIRLVDAAGLPTAEFGDSDTLRMGHWVLTIGHPYDFPFTVTAGIVSALGRRDLVPSEIQDYIQTDASVNPGSSGGPLFDLDGRVVGINTAIFAPGGEAIQQGGIAFAIPSNMARRVAGELETTGRVALAAIGLTSRDAEGSGQRGAEVTRIAPGGPADLAGLRRGDIVVSVGSQVVTSSDALRALVRARGVGAQLQFAFLRGGERLVAVVSSVDAGRLRETDRVLPADAQGWGGMLLASATPDLLREYGVVPPVGHVGGVLVLEAEVGGAGHTAGLAAGDLLVEVQKDPVEDLDAFFERIGRRRTVMVSFYRHEAIGYAAVSAGG